MGAVAEYLNEINQVGFNNVKNLLRNAKLILFKENSLLSNYILLI